MAQIAEIHVMQKLHKEKMKIIKNEENKTCGSGNCYSWLGKKVSCATRQLLSCAGSKHAICDYKDT
ncbi:hypothetical protein RND71_026851 [Anisodus tanguticus]|uniref:Uncharacterized protein n=1 Tax=Anisodus tanguticus TaxID=243964 RepID=A0AAE1RP33_9SOLA|nr:hypothetical protein RND71_026851 [Anisodus tanguticus]